MKGESALIELNLENLETRGNKLMMKFAKAGVDSGNLQGIFRLSNTTNNMELRQPDKYRTTMAHTEGFRMSTIPYLQRQLNLEEKNK